MKSTAVLNTLSYTAPADLSAYDYDDSRRQSIVEEAVVGSEPGTVLSADTASGLETDTTVSEILPDEVSVGGDETAADVTEMELNRLPVFKCLVYRPSPLSMSVSIDETLITRSTAALGANVRQNGFYPTFSPSQSISLIGNTSQRQVWTSATRPANTGLEVRALPGAEAIWEERGGEDSGVGKGGGFGQICCGVGGESLFRDGHGLDRGGQPSLLKVLDGNPDRRKIYAQSEEMRSSHGTNSISYAAPRRSERLRQRRLAKETQIPNTSESTTAVAGSKRRFEEDPVVAKISLRRIKLLFKAEEPVVNDGTVLEAENTSDLERSVDMAQWEILQQQISVAVDETAADLMDVDLNPLPIFRRLEYRPSRLSMSVFMDEAQETQHTAVLSTNACRAEPSLDKRHLTRKCGIWKSEHLRQLRRYGQREAERILDMRIEAERNTVEAEEAALKDSLFTDMDEDWTNRHFFLLFLEQLY
ncbi:hypothetical protein BJ741DRAFT_715193 [Chytriomyces cf. hyalinus JEL632]|nr:hypothetical protein BJ741DRAFT_715193 [Chytriomyces cf. hyalinus JEL632]